MSLNWQWTDKMGEVIFQDCDTEHPFKTNIYQGNALMIWVNEFPYPKETLRSMKQAGYRLYVDGKLQR